MQVAAIATGSTFFLVGAIKTYWTHRTWWRSGLETLVIGLLAAGIAYQCGSYLATFEAMKISMLQSCQRDERQSSSLKADSLS